MNHHKRAALIPLAAAAAILLLNARRETNTIPTDQATQQARRILADPIARCTRQQRIELADFYDSCANLCPQLKHVAPNLTNAQFRSILETAARLRFTDRFKPVEGLSAAIHGPNGTIATLYTLDQGPFDAARAEQALKATANACRPPSPLARLLP